VDVAPHPLRRPRRRGRSEGAEGWWPSLTPPTRTAPTILIAAAGREVRTGRPPVNIKPFMTTAEELVVFYPSPRATPTATDTPP
jgi:hypothetical protein